MIEYIEIDKEAEMELEGVVIKQIKEDGHLRSLFIKDNLGKSYKIKVGDSYSKSLSVMQPKPITIKKYKLTMWVDRAEEIKKEFDLETEELATIMRINLERK